MNNTKINNTKINNTKINNTKINNTEMKNIRTEDNIITPIFNLKIKEKEYKKSSLTDDMDIDSNKYYSSAPKENNIKNLCEQIYSAK